MACDDERGLSEIYLKEIEQMNLPEEVSYSLGLLMAQWRVNQGKLWQFSLRPLLDSHKAHCPKTVKLGNLLVLTTHLFFHLFSFVKYSVFKMSASKEKEKF